MIVRAFAPLLSLVTFAGCAAATSTQAAGGMDPRRVASCVIAAEYLAFSVKSDSDGQAKYNASKDYYAGHLALMVPEETRRASLLNEGRMVLGQTLVRQSGFTGLVMVGDVLSQCDSDRPRLEQYTAGLRNG